MNFIKRGFLGITRKKGKSFILLAVIFILGNIISGAISIQQATANVEDNIKERLGANATVHFDWQTYESLSYEEQEEITHENLSVEAINQIGQLPYVKYYDYNMYMPLDEKSQSLEIYHSEASEGLTFEFHLHGINYAPVLDFEEGEGEIVNGRTFTQDEVDSGAFVAVISDKLAEKNNVHVGDTITLTNAIYSYDDANVEEEIFSSRDLVLEIIGIFQSLIIAEDPSTVGPNGVMDWSDIGHLNTIYLPNEVVKNERDFETEEKQKIWPDMGPISDFYLPLFVLNSHEDVEAFEEEAYPLLPEYYLVSSSTDHYDSISGPIESMSNLSNYVLIAAIFATILITGLVVLLFLRDRKHELGIYLSLGEERGRVIGQILIEVIVVAFIGITLSLFSGNFLASQVSDTLITADDQSAYGHMMGYQSSQFESDLTTEDVLASYEITLDSNYVLVFYGVGLLTILISTLIPLIYIVRLNPKKILM